MRGYGTQCGGVRASSQYSLSRHRQYTPAAVCFDHPRLYIRIQKTPRQSHRKLHGLCLPRQNWEQHRLNTLPRVQNSDITKNNSNVMVAS
eukprot:80815-Pyramimonas_sp.AAC.1